MSSLFRDLKSLVMRAGGNVCVAAVAAGLPSAAAFAADAYFVPEGEVSTEYHTNLGLETEDTPLDTEVYGYRALLGGIAGYRTLRSTTELRPRVRFQDYPDRDDLKRTNGSLDLKSNYRSLRSNLEFLGSYRREDILHAEIVEAAFDDFDPTTPPVGDTGRVDVFSERRTTVQLRPSAEFRISERLGVGIDTLYQTVSYDAPPSSNRVDYDYWLVNPALIWGMGPRTRLSTGVYASKYESDDSLSKTESQGASLDLEHSWSETLSATAELLVERTDVDEVGFTDKSNNWGLSMGLLRSGQVGRLRMTLGRYFTPSGGGTRTEQDELRVQYDRNLTQRWALMGAVRAFQTQAQGRNAAASNDRDFARGELELRWLMTQTWSVGARYTFTWQDRESEIDDAHDHLFLVRVAYKGLPPQR